MLHTNVTSALDPHSPFLVAMREQLDQLAATRAPGSSNTMSGIDRALSNAANVPQTLAMRSNANEEAPQSGQTDAWVTRTMGFSPGAPVNPDFRKAYTRLVLTATAMASSDYWQQYLGGPALCVRHDESGWIACRVSPLADSGLDMHESDAVIQVTPSGPQAYSWSLGRTLPNGRNKEPFFVAATQAALSQLYSSESWLEDPDQIQPYEKALRESMVTWINGKQDVLEKMALQMMRAEQAPT